MKGFVFFVFAETRVGIRFTNQIDIDTMVGNSPAFLREIEKAAGAAAHDVCVLIQGETGTGKEVCARAIHRNSKRKDRPFVPINGGAIPVDLLENELFGHGREAYTGAKTRREGLIAEAEGGTIFVDEIDSFPLAAQVKFLRFLQEKEYRPLGTQQMLRANVRVVAATNAELPTLLKEGRLRSDLYYRLNTVPITLPPLRERQEDIIPLARYFLHKYNEQFGGCDHEFSPEALMNLQLHSWPGNVRELEQTVVRAIVLGGDNRIIEFDSGIISDLDQTEKIPTFQEAKARVVEEFERGYIVKILRAHQGNITRAARAACKNRRAFWELMRKHDIDADSFRPSSP